PISSSWCRRAWAPRRGRGPDRLSAGGCRCGLGHGLPAQLHVLLVLTVRTLRCIGGRAFGRTAAGRAAGRAARGTACGATDRVGCGITCRAGGSTAGWTCTGTTHGTTRGAAHGATRGAAH